MSKRLFSNISRHRLRIWDAEKTRQDFLRSQFLLSQRPESVELFLSDGSRITARRKVDAPLNFLKARNLKDDVVIALINGVPWDLQRPIEDGGQLSFLPASLALNFDAGDRDGATVRETIWHSGAHLLGWAMERHFCENVLLDDGPAVRGHGGLGGGFFYDGLLVNDGVAQHSNDIMTRAFDDGAPLESIGESILESFRTERGLLHDIHQNHRSVSDTDLDSLSVKMKELSLEAAPFVRLEVSRFIAALMFCYSPLKLRLLQQIGADEKITVYRCGDFIDLCRGPHVSHTGLLSACKALRTGAVQWGPDPAIRLSRVHGIAFSRSQHLREWESRQRDAAARDHRVIGRAQGLFMMNPMAPGSAFMLPHGTRIAQRLTEFMRSEYRYSGYDEVITPLIFDQSLWETSGHWDKYKDDMFVVSDRLNEVGPAEARGNEGDLQSSHFQGLKPMNCPGHCLVFNNRLYSYRELPVRIAEFSPLHRNEASGALTGLTRVRKFHQDDAHIFCAPDQVLQEIQATFQFIDRVYKKLGLPSYELLLSTRPDSFIGSIDQWDSAETALISALDQAGQPYRVNKGDGAFYGPKIDVIVHDAIGRNHQTATIQLDFQLPQRFGLTYMDSSGARQIPVIIHRAILGSVERMLAILTEHYSGKWPFWLSPRQAVVIPATNSPSVIQYAEDVARCLAQNGRGLQKLHSRYYDLPLSPNHTDTYYYVDSRCHDADQTLGKRIREAWASRYNYAIVVGEVELQSGTVSVRSSGEMKEKERDILREISISDLLILFEKQ